MKLLRPDLPSRGWLIVFLLLAFAAVADAAPARPFKASIDWTVTGQGRMQKCPTDNPGVLGGGQQFQGTGHGTHLGSLHFLGSHCVVPRQQVNFLFSNGELIVTSASGDVLNLDYSGNLTLVSPDVYSFEGNFIVTGGTGRFQDATGTGALFGTGSLTNLSLTAEGRISF